MVQVGIPRWLLEGGARPARGFEHVHRVTLVPASLDSTFSFFADAGNLEWLTPPWLALRVTTVLPVTMATALELDYRISLWGVSIPWRSVIDVWIPGACFVDRQVIGPYRWWRHEHRFEAAPGGTRVIDHVEYVPRLRWATSPIVRRDLGRIFDYRQQALRRHFASEEGRRRGA
jgi:ligand-binding SRPBCC domain-containing protein